MYFSLTIVLSTLFLKKKKTLSTIAALSVIEYIFFKKNTTLQNVNKYNSNMKHKKVT